MEYVINTEQKRTLTGVRNKLWRKLQRMNPTDAMAMTYADLEDLVERLEQVVQPLDDAENKRINDLIDYYRVYQDSHSFSSTWSMWEDPTGKENRVWMDSDHPYAEGAVIEYDASMGDGKIYKVTIEGTQWIDVWKACDKLIQLSTDRHHRCIEALRERDGEDGVLVLWTGS